MELFGNIDNPLINYGPVDDPGSGLIFFLSNIIKLATVAAGLFTFINLVIAGFQFVTSTGDPKLTQAAWGRINMSLIGLVIIVSAYTLAAIIGFILFGDFNAILTPTIYGPGQPSTGGP